MTPEKRQLAEHLLLNHSVPDVKALLNRSISGEKVTYAQVESVRRVMVTEGKLAARTQNGDYRAPCGLKPDAKPYVDPQAQARLVSTAQASARLHDATIEMYVRKANRHGWTLQQAAASCLAPGSMAA